MIYHASGDRSSQWRPMISSKAKIAGIAVNANMSSSYRRDNEA